MGEQRQDSTIDQLGTIRRLAIEAGCYDGLDYLSEMATARIVYRDKCNRVEALLAASQARERELREALEVMADPGNWSDSPESSGSVLFGHFTPYELARRALDGAAGSGGEGPGEC